MARLYGLIGYPLSHSFSRTYFSEKFSQENLQDCDYLNFEIDHIDKFPEIIKDHPDLRGINVTIPYKEQVMQYLDDLDESAEKVGAVNVIKVDGKSLTGYNSDIYGFGKSLEGNLSKQVQNALILGSGGASKAVKAALTDLGIPYKVVSRNPEQHQVNYDQANLQLTDSQLIINTTPLGMSPNLDSFPPLDYSKMGEDHLLFDLVYNPEKTLFLQKGESQGARIVNGLEMLILQAERSWEIWNS